MNELTKALNLNFMICVLLFTATGISDCADSSSSEETDDFENINSAAPRNKVFKPFIPPNKQDAEYASTANVWIIAVAVIGSTVLFIVFCFCLYFLTYGRGFFQRRILRRQPRANAGAVPLTTGAVPLTQFNVSGAVPGPTAPPITVFEESQNGMSVANRRNAGQPEYTIVLDEDPAEGHLQGPPAMQKRSETPPPAYTTVVPYK